MSSVAMSQPRAERPSTVQAAVAVVVVSAVVGNVTLASGGPEGAKLSAFIIAGVSIGLHLFGGWGLWRLWRWGLILTAVLTVFDFVASVPFLLDDASQTWFIIACVVFMLADIAILALLAQPTTRRAVLGDAGASRR
jgi:hypothetical protein